MWEQEYKGKTGIHLRRVHYQLDAIGFLKPDGMPYTNPGDWELLLNASKWARILGLVPVDAFEDHRNPEPHPLNWRDAGKRVPAISKWLITWAWELPSLSSSNWSLDPPRVDGYAPDDYLDRAYLLEVWIEKSTMDDILVPLCEELGVRLVPSAGFQSLTNAVRLLQRVCETQKPARIFYISDHDKAGRQMPVAVARQIEFWRKDYPQSDVKLSVLALTKEQIAGCKLPVNKKGATELDALEAIVPGELESIVRRAIKPYLDDSIDEQLAEAERTAGRIVRQEWSRLMVPHNRTLEDLNRRVKAIREKNQKRLDRELRPFRKPLARLKAEVERAASGFNPELPVRPAQEVSEQNEQDWLFDSGREYLEQLAFYKEQKAK
jgi:hypothetical protein